MTYLGGLWRGQLQIRILLKTCVLRLKVYLQQLLKTAASFLKLGRLGGKGKKRYSSHSKKAARKKKQGTTKTRTKLMGKGIEVISLEKELEEFHSSE